MTGFGDSLHMSWIIILFFGNSLRVWDAFYPEINTEIVIAFIDAKPSYMFVWKFPVILYLLFIWFPRMLVYKTPAVPRARLCGGVIFVCVSHLICISTCTYQTLIFLSLTVLWLLPGALNACPQSSPGICLLPVRRLQHFVSELPPLGGFYTAYNQSGLMEICKYDCNSWFRQ